MPRRPSRRSIGTCWLFTFAIALLTGVLFGLLPALRISKLDVNSVLKEASGRSGTGLRHNRVRGVLVAAEMALAVILVAGAALMIRTFVGLRSVQPGFDPHNVITLQTSLRRRPVRQHRQSGEA